MKKKDKDQTEVAAGEYIIAESTDAALHEVKILSVGEKLISDCKKEGRPYLQPGMVGKVLVAPHPLIQFQGKECLVFNESSFVTVSLP